MDSKQVLNDIALRIKRRRNEIGLSLQDVANMTGMSKSTLQRYENGGIKNLPLQKLEVLARALQTSQEWLLKGGETAVSIALNTVMEAEKVTPAQLAKSLGVPLQIVNEWLSGESSPSYDLFPKLSNILHVFPSYFTDPDSIPRYLAEKDEYAIFHPFEEKYPPAVKSAAHEFMSSLQPIINCISDTDPEIITPCVTCLCDIGNTMIDMLKVFSIRKKSGNVEYFKHESDKYFSDVRNAYAIFQVQLIRLLENQSDSSLK